MNTMMETYGIMGVPGLGLIGLLIVGVVAGYIAEKVTGSSMGLLSNMLIGVVGAIVGNAIAGFAGLIVPGGMLWQIVTAALGAILVLYVWRRVRGGATT